MSSFFETACQTIQREGMLTDTDTVVVGFSGGADSVSLLHLLHSHREELGLSQVVAVHIDHRLRGEESERDRRFAQAFCEERGIPFYLFSYDVAAIAKQERLGLEETGRSLRHAAFSEVAARYPRSRIATAHTADDNVETLLLNLCRGCSLHGLTGIPPAYGVLPVHPLLDCTRADVEQYCAEQKLDYVTDSSNTDLHYSRNRIRHEVLPSLEKINPSAKRVIGRMIGQMRDFDRLFSRLSDECQNEISTERPNEYTVEPLQRADDVVQREVLKRMLVAAHLPFDEHHIRCMQKSLLNGQNATLPRGYIFTVLRDRCMLVPPSEAVQEPIAEQPLLVDVKVRLGGAVYRALILSRKEYEQKLNICPQVFKNACDYDMITDVPILRGRLEGDAYHPVGRSCGKSLKKLFNEAAVPIERRKTIPVIADNSGIVLVFGFGCDERVRITEATTRVLLLEKTEE